MRGLYFLIYKITYKINLNTMTWFAKITEKERERRARNEAAFAIQITDYDNEIALTINGIKAMTITDVQDGINKLKELREEYVRKQITKS